MRRLDAAFFLLRDGESCKRRRGDSRREKKKKLEKTISPVTLGLLTQPNDGQVIPYGGW